MKKGVFVFVVLSLLVLPMASAGIIDEWFVDTFGGDDDIRLSPGSLGAEYFDSTSDKAGPWSTFSANGENDFHLRAYLNGEAGVGKTLKSVRLDHAWSGEYWVTNGGGYPVVIYNSTGDQVNTGHVDSLDYILTRGESFDLYVQAVHTPFEGATLTFTFTDGASLSASIPKPVSVNSGCTDTDTGRDYGNRGVVTHNGVEYPDECGTALGTNGLNEQFCSGGLRITEFWNCAAAGENFACVEVDGVGACVDTSAPAASCTDSDGGVNIYVRGQVSGTDGEFLDVCIIGGAFDGQLNEFACVDGQATFDTHECPNGCQDGVCLPAGDKAGPSLFSFVTDGTDRIEGNVEIKDGAARFGLIYFDHGTNTFRAGESNDGRLANAQELTSSNTITYIERKGGIDYHEQLFVSNSNLKESYLISFVIREDNGRNEVTVINRVTRETLASDKIAGDIIDVGSVKLEIMEIDFDSVDRGVTLRGVGDGVNFAGVYDTNGNSIALPLGFSYPESTMMTSRVWDSKGQAIKAYHFKWNSDSKSFVSIDCTLGCGDSGGSVATCTDSDGGLNYNVKGDAKWGSSGIVVDGCFDGNRLDEAFCNEDGIGGTIDYECPNGCQDGACLPAPACDNGCLDGDKCLPYGFRVGEQYCDLTSDSLVGQKGLEASCTNNFECGSNACSAGVCVADQRNIIERVVDFFRILFGIDLNQGLPDYMIVNNIGEFEYDLGSLQDLGDFTTLEENKFFRNVRANLSGDVSIPQYENGEFMNYLGDNGLDNGVRAFVAEYNSLNIDGTQFEEFVRLMFDTDDIVRAEIDQGENGDVAILYGTSVDGQPADGMKMYVWTSNDKVVGVLFEDVGEIGAEADDEFALAYLNQYPSDYQATWVSNTFTRNDAHSRNNVGSALNIGQDRLINNYRDVTFYRDDPVTAEFFCQEKGYERARITQVSAPSETGWQPYINLKISYRSGDNTAVACSSGSDCYNKAQSEGLEYFSSIECSKVIEFKAPTRAPAGFGSVTQPSESAKATAATNGVLL